jgi:hypothetical protein
MHQHDGGPGPAVAKGASRWVPTAQVVTAGWCWCCGSHNGMELNRLIHRCTQAAADTTSTVRAAVEHRSVMMAAHLALHWRFWRGLECFTGKKKLLKAHWWQGDGQGAFPPNFKPIPTPFQLPRLWRLTKCLVSVLNCTCVLWQAGVCSCSCQAGGPGELPPLA